MAILKIKVIDGAGAPLDNKDVNVSGVGTLQTNALGMVQYLIDAGVTVDITINDTACWSGDTTALAKEEVFQQSVTGYTRVTTP